MEGEVDRQSIENSCPENRDLGEIVRWVERFQGGDPSLHWQETRERYAGALNSFLQGSDKSRKLIAKLQGAEYEIGGDEHFVIRVDEDPERVFKVTSSPLWLP